MTKPSDLPLHLELKLLKILLKLDKWKQLCVLLKGLGNTSDYSVCDKEGKHPKQTYLSMVRWGTINLEELAPYIEELK